jgi:class 3 adenylate cyclase
MNSLTKSSLEVSSLDVPSVDVPSLEVVAPRRLAAILAADIKDYSRLMGADEEGTVARVTGQRQNVIVPIVDQNHGQVVKTMGDGFLAVFNSPLDAVRCALVLQVSTAEQDAAVPIGHRLRHRIGINLGDVIVTASDIYGDSVNIAARLQQLAEPGGICISGSVYDQIKSKLACGYRSRGDERLKNIIDPVRVYQVLPYAVAMAPVRHVRLAAVLALAAFVAAAAAAGWWFGFASRGPAVVAAAPASLVESVDRRPAAAAESQPDIISSEQRREVVFRRMAAALSNAQTPAGWLTVERLAVIAGVTEAEAHDILAEHFPRDVMLRKGPAGRLVAHLAEH